MNKTQLLKDWQAMIDTFAKGASVAIAIQMQDGRQIYSYSNHPEMRYEMASSVKVSVLSLLLHQTKGQLNERQDKLAKLMIRHSDNDATTTICKDYLGGIMGLQKLYPDLQMNHTTASAWWGTTLTIPTDQLKLLKMIYLDASSDYLNDQSRHYIRHLMHTVTAWQRWGISSGSTDFYLKNGWRQAEDNAKWETHSIGFIPNHGNGYTIAIYTRNNPSFARGVMMVEDLARITKDDVNN